MNLLEVPVCQGGEAVLGATQEIFQGAQFLSTLENELLFGSEEDRMHQLDDEAGSNLITHSVPNRNGSELPGCFDACNEYGYKYECSVNDGDEGTFQGAPILPLDVSMASNRKEGSHTSHHMG